MAIPALACAQWRTCISLTTAACCPCIFEQMDAAGLHRWWVCRRCRGCTPAAQAERSWCCCGPDEPCLLATTTSTNLPSALTLLGGYHNLHPSLLRVRSRPSLHVCSPCVGCLPLSPPLDRLLLTPVQLLVWLPRLRARLPHHSAVCVWRRRCAAVAQRPRGSAGLCWAAPASNRLRLGITVCAAHSGLVVPLGSLWRSAAPCACTRSTPHT